MQEWQTLDQICEELDIERNRIGLIKAINEEHEDRLKEIDKEFMRQVLVKGFLAIGVASVSLTLIVLGLRQLVSILL